ncbi:uncharacterized protein N7458_003702 [Penicillium daleae]|uniref:DUF1857-domain-containing protein n=1 Tax=Penicillium daleae TaxID=63821 RepID=A0AAD6CA34_9EURO|nr:uncharacterized protein N7458_003702 [Penicillium daleae]KAJ5456119.1 hypothetical protein N7458_003702 [Penicillium daleae]
MSTNNLAFTAPLNPDGATPVLNKDQIWAGLLLKIQSAESFVPKAIESTTVISKSADQSSGNPVTVREVIFRDDKRKVRETVTAYEPTQVIFVQPNGSSIANIVSEDADGKLYMTYTFEWRHPGASKAELATFMEREKKMSKMAVEGTITALREMVKSGKL